MASERTEELYRVLLSKGYPKELCAEIAYKNMNTDYTATRMLGYLYRYTNPKIEDLVDEMLKIFQDCGFIYHSKVTIWKNPVTEMQRTKALGLLHKQIKKDSSMSRQGLPDYVITVRKPGDNPERVEHTNESFPVNVWQNYASPVWMDIRQSDTLQRKSARSEQDEKHICPLQLEVIQRCIELWTNPNDIVFDPFGGIGSTPYVALKLGRRGIASELKDSYFEQLKKNVESVAAEEPEVFPVGEKSIEDVVA